MAFIDPKWNFPGACVLAGLGLALLVGCAGGGSSLGAWPGAARERMAEARQAYLAGEYDRAGDLFETLAGNRTAPALARRAALGLACSRLAAADTDQEVAAALDVWRDWLSRSPDPWPEEDRELLLPLLARLAAWGPGRTGSGNQTGPPPSLGGDSRYGAQANGTVGRGQRPGRPDDPAALRQQVKDKAREIEKLAAQLRDRGQENERLRKQLNALERLHQEMTTKMKSLE